MGKEIILCNKCNGEGVRHHSELQDYHKGEYRYWTTTCPTCEGSGRLEMEVITTFTPYKYDT